MMIKHKPISVERRGEIFGYNNRHDKEACVFRKQGVRRCQVELLEDWELGISHHQRGKETEAILSRWQIFVKTNYHIHQVSKNPTLAGIMISWAVELSKYEIIYVSRGSIKSQALVGFMAEFSSPREWDFSSGRCLLTKFLEDETVEFDVEESGLVLSGIFQEVWHSPNPTSRRNSTRTRFKFQTEVIAFWSYTKYQWDMEINRRLVRHAKMTRQTKRHLNIGKPLVS